MRLSRFNWKICGMINTIKEIIHSQEENKERHRWQIIFAILTIHFLIHFSFNRKFTMTFSSDNKSNIWHFGNFVLTRKTMWHVHEEAINKAFHQEKSFFENWRVCVRGCCRMCLSINRAWVVNEYIHTIIWRKQRIVFNIVFTQPQSNTCSNSYCHFFPSKC